MPVQDSTTSRFAVRVQGQSGETVLAATSREQAKIAFLKRCAGSLKYTDLRARKISSPHKQTLIIKHLGYRDTALVSLTQGMWALIDETDSVLVCDRKWWAAKSGLHRISYYAETGQHHLRMHRLITGSVADEVDHKNRNTLDNRRMNLRDATGTQNQGNRGVNEHHGRPWKGVYPTKNRKGWYASICLNKKQRYIGTFTDAEDAARAYDAKAKELFGEFARLNLP